MLVKVLYQVSWATGMAERSTVVNAESVTDGRARVHESLMAAGLDSRILFAVEAE